MSGATGERGSSRAAKIGAVAIDLPHCAPMTADQLNLALFVLRIASGLMIMAHGYNHIFLGGKIEGTGRWFASMGMRPGIVHAWLASISELAAGLGLVFGFLTAPAAGGLLGVMLVAFITAHRNNGFFIFKPGQGWEYVAFISCVAVAIGTVGAGEWSLDDALDIHQNGWAGLVTTLLIGVGGTVALLGTCWRPNKK